MQLLIHALHACFWYQIPCISYCFSDHFAYVPSKWEMVSQSNIVSHWLDACTKWSLLFLYWSSQSDLSLVVYNGTDPTTSRLWWIGRRPVLSLLMLDTTAAGGRLIFCRGNSPGCVYHLTKDWKKLLDSLLSDELASIFYLLMIYEGSISDRVYRKYKWNKEEKKYLNNWK